MLYLIYVCDLDSFVRVISRMCLHVVPHLWGTTWRFMCVTWSVSYLCVWHEACLDSFVRVISRMSRTNESRHTSCSFVRVSQDTQHIRSCLHVRMRHIRDITRTNESRHTSCHTHTWATCRQSQQRSCVVSRMCLHVHSYSLVNVETGARECGDACASNTLQHIASHCNTPQHTATHCLTQYCICHIHVHVIADSNSL